MNNLKKLKLSLLVLLFSTNCLSRDTLDIPKHKAGVFMIYEFAKGGLADQPKYKYGADIGAFYERKLTKRFVFTTELSFRLREFILTHGELRRRSGPNYDYIRNVYQTDWNLSTTSLTVGFKYFYLKRPKLYLEVGGGIDYRLREAPEKIYKITHLLDSGRKVGEEYIEDQTITRSDRVLAIRINKIYGRVDLSLGVIINEFDISLVYKRDFVDSFGLRTKYSFWKKE